MFGSAPTALSTIGVSPMACCFCGKIIPSHGVFSHGPDAGETTMGRFPSTFDSGDFNLRQDQLLVLLKHNIPGEPGFHIACCLLNQTETQPAIFHDFSDGGGEFTGI